MKTRAELDAEIFQLRAALPLWRRALPSEHEFHAHCDFLAASIIEAAAPDDRDYAAQHLHGALEQHTRVLRAFGALSSP